MRKVKFGEEIGIDEVKRDRETSELYAVFGGVRLRVFIKGVPSRRQRRVLANAIYLRILPKIHAMILKAMR